MRKIAVLLTIAMLTSVVVPSMAVAKTRTKHVKVKATATVAKKSGKAKSVVISSKASRAGRTVVTIYKGKKVVRKIRTAGKAKKRTVKWNLKDTKGKQVTTGTYTYKVQVVSGSAVGAVQGLVSISKPKRKPARPTAPVTAPVVTPVVNPAPTPEPAPEPAKGRWIGMWMPYIASDPAKLAEAETMLGGKLHVIQIFQADSEGGFPTSRVDNIVANGSIPLITLGLNCTEGTGPSAITNGVADTYLHSYAKAAKQYGTEIWFRPFHEMNGDWYPWSGTGNGTPAQVVAAWKHVYEIFQAEGATNVKFVWCPNGESVPNTSANAIEKYWPGDAYVDMVAVDTYNAGLSASWSHWQTIDEAMGPAYKSITALTDKPLFIAETSCSEKGGDKAAWITETFAKFTTVYPRVTGVVWFNEKLAEDWRVNSSESSLQAFRTVMANGY